MKKILKILVIVVFAIYFIGNVLPNLIGVPLAAYHSYQSWNEMNEHNEVINQRKVSSVLYQKFPKPIGYVNDFENILTKEQEIKLDKRIKAFEFSSSNEIAIITIGTIEPYENISSFALDLSNEWGVGKSETNNGLLILISKSLREIRISTGTGTEKILTDEICKNIIDLKMIPEFKKGDYFEGIEKGLEELIAKWN